MTRSIRVSRTLPYTAHEIWTALVDPDELREWFCDNDFQPAVGHKFRFRDRPRMGWNGIMECEVLVVDPPRTLSYSFKSNMLKDTIVTILLEPDGDGTRVVIEHAGFRGIGEWFVSHMLRGGWGKMLRVRLPAVLVARRSTVEKARV